MEYEIDREALRRFLERWARIDAMEAELDEMANDITERSRKADEDIARLGADLEDLKRGCNDLQAEIQRRKRKLAEGERDEGNEAHD